MTEPAAAAAGLGFRHRLAARLLVFYIRLVFATTRWTWHGPTFATDAMARGEPLILAFWHGRMLVMPVAKPATYAARMLISENRDGAFIASVIAQLGTVSIRGSTLNPKKPGKAKGGSKALRDMLDTLKSGIGIGITPDGPRGPRMRAQEGVAALARLSGVPVCPVTYATRWRYIVGSWDRFHLALPFSRGVIVLGEPVHVPSDARGDTMEHWRVRIEASLNDATAEADRLVGHTPVLPAGTAP